MEKKDTELSKAEMRAIRLRAREKILARDKISNEKMAESLIEIGESMQATDSTQSTDPAPAFDLIKVIKALK